MRDWREKLDAFLRFNEWQILDHPGKVAMATAKQLALEKYETFHKRRLQEGAASEADEFELLARKIKPKSKHGR